MAQQSDANDDQYLPDEAARRRDEVLKRLMQTPPKRHEEMKLGRPRRKQQSPRDSDQAPERH